MAEGPGSESRGAEALILAAGSGQRLGAGRPKALVEVAGRPMFEWSLRACREAASVGGVTVVVPPGEAKFPAIPGGGGSVKRVTGGESRSQSVTNGLVLVESELVVVHDAARPLVSGALIDACTEELAGRPELDCVVAAAPASDTIKVVDEGGIVTETLDRSWLWVIQTPQVFRTGKLREALRSGDIAAATDDASLIEAMGGAVSVLHWREPNVKITTMADLRLVDLQLGIHR